MRLELAIHSINQMGFGDATRLIGTRLEINREELRDYLLSDKRLQRVDLEIAQPEENCRIGPVADVLEPRAKEAGSGPDFPGIFGPLAPVGQGTTHVLRGAAVTVLDDSLRRRPSSSPTGAIAGRGASLIEMQGPAADASPYGHLQHLVVVPHVAPEAEWHTYKNVQRIASCKAAVYLGRAAFNQPPSTTEVFELEGPSVSGRHGLPRVAYIAQISSGQMGVDPDEQIFYGSNLLGFIPTLVHPNEWLDGAIVTSNTGASSQTFLYQNNPVVLDLYDRHRAGKVTFVGVIATTAPGIEDQRARNTMYAAHLAKWNLRADGALVDRYPAGGATAADMIETARQCELIGIKSVVFVQDSAGDRRVESASLMQIPEVKDVVIVAGGMGGEVRWKLPASERVIAGNPDIAEQLAEPQEVGAAQICGVAGVQGGSKLQSILY